MKNHTYQQPFREKTNLSTASKQPHPSQNASKNDNKDNQLQTKTKTSTVGIFETTRNMKANSQKQNT